MEVDYRAALARMHQPRPDFVSVASLLALTERAGAALTRAQREAWQAKPGDTRAADRVAATLGDTPAPYLRFLLADFYEHVGAHEAGLAAVTRAVAETPCWDTMLVAWAYNGVATALANLGRTDEARAVIEQLWPFDPYYPGALETARRVGAALPGPGAGPASPPRGGASSLRLALTQHLYEGNREPGFRATAMAMSLVWEGQHLAAASLAELGAGLPGPSPDWPRGIAALARAKAAQAPGALAPLPAGSRSARLKAVRAAHKTKHLALLETAALDPEHEVARAAWTALLDLGHRAEELETLLREAVAATHGERGHTIRAEELRALLDEAPLPALSAVALVERALRALEAGAKGSLPSGAASPSEHLAASAALLPPSLVAWLREGSLDELTPSPALSLARRAHGALFDAMPAKLAACPALPLQLPETVNDRLEVLLLAHPDDAGETPVVAFDVSESPTITIAAESFGAWLADDVGLGRLRPNDATKRAAKAALGKAKLAL